MAGRAVDQAPQSGRSVCAGHGREDDHVQAGIPGKGHAVRLEVEVAHHRVVVDAFTRGEAIDVVGLPGGSEVIAGVEKPLDQASERGLVQTRAGFCPELREMTCAVESPVTLQYVQVGIGSSQVYQVRLSPDRYATSSRRTPVPRRPPAGRPRSAGASFDRRALRNLPNSRRRCSPLPGTIVPDLYQRHEALRRRYRWQRKLVASVCGAW